MSRIIIENFDEETELIKWFRFIHGKRCVDFSTNEQLEIDFRKTRLLKPFQLVSLACLGDEYYNSGKKVVIKFNMNKRSGDFINRIGYKHVWRPGTFENKFLRYIQANTVPVWKLDRDNLEGFLMSTEKFYQKHNLKNKDTSPLRIALAETLNNILDHAGTRNAYVISQYYPAAKKMEIVVCDFGNGIPNCVNSYLKSNSQKQLKQSKALLKALEKGFSTKSTPQNRGLGLDNVLSGVAATFGELLIISNSAFLMKQKRKNAVKEIIDDLEYSFPGTFIKITLNAEYFQVIENEVATEEELI